MSEFIVNNKTITTFVVVFIIVAAIVGVISYNLGVNYGLKQQSPSGLSANQPNNTNTNTPASMPDNQEPINNETVIAGEPVVTADQTTLIGELSAVTTTGFKLAVTADILNQTTGQLSQRVTNYTVTVNSQTKITERTATVERPVGLEPAKVTTTTKNLRLSDLKDGEVVAVVTADDAADLTITAVSVTVNEQVIK